MTVSACVISFPLNGFGIRGPSARWTAAGRFLVADISHDSAHRTQRGTGTPTPDRTFGDSSPVVMDRLVNNGHGADSTSRELASPIPP